MNEARGFQVYTQKYAQKYGHWIGPCASFLCLIHCFGTAALAVIAPGILKALPHSEWVEFVFLSVSFVFGSLTLRRHKAPAVLQALMAFVALVGATGWSVDSHRLMYAAMIALGLVPFALVVAKHRAAKQPACCDGSH